MQETKHVMNKIPSQLIKDYCLIAISYMLLILALHPVYFGEYRITETIALLTFVQTVILCIVISGCEAFVTYILHDPFSYSDTLTVRAKHFLRVELIGIPLMTIVLLFSSPLLEHGIEHLDYAFLERDGSFTLKWVFGCLSACLIASLVMLAALVALSEIRHKSLMMRELEAINNALTLEHETASKETEKSDEKITLQGEGREALVVNPHDIIYVESIANYLNIVYFNQTDLCQKRIRCSLHDSEIMLEAYPYIVHIHRAFLVNLRFVTNITGNAAGYKLDLFGVDKTLPVSKANIATFKEKMFTQSRAKGRL